MHRHSARCEASRCSDQGSDESSALKTVALVVPAFGRLALTTFPRGHADAIGHKNTHIAQGMRVSGFRACQRAMMPRCWRCTNIVNGEHAVDRHLTEAFANQLLAQCFNPALARSVAARPL